jgi:GNAT superfamily N-acetyltransferase
VARPAIVPFSEEHVEPAAALLAERHERHRRSIPQLPADVDYAAELRALLADGATGAFAEDAYVLGARGTEHWGANIWLDAAGHAANDPELLRDVWAAAAGPWFEQGLKEHYVLVPATDQSLIEAWFRLGFGAQHVYGLMEIPDREWPPGVREATEDDVEALVALGPLLYRHQLQSPVFSHFQEQSPDAIREEVLEDFTHDTVVNLVYERDGRIVGNFAVYPVELATMHSGLARLPAAAVIPFAVTEPGVRGSGAGVALTDASFAWARANGYETMVADWRAANLAASRFWPRRGFSTSFLRLHRSLP